MVADLAVEHLGVVPRGGDPLEELELRLALVVLRDVGHHLQAAQVAVFAFSDRLALAAREAARERGLSVPGDLSIVGFDDTAPAGDGLTSVHQPLREKGRIAAERLLGALSQGPPAPGAGLLPTRLVVRDSTAPPQRAGSTAT